MKNYWSFLKNERKSNILLFTILSLLFIYFLIGIFPITRFETDSMAISNACEEMIQSGHFEENVLGHSYHMQSGTYFLIITLAKTFGLSAFSSYSILTVVFAFIYWIVLYVFLRKMTNANPYLIVIILFLFQEIFILSYYANSTVIASAFWIIAFYIIWIRSDYLGLIVSSIFLALAAWCRVDVAFTFPSVLLLLYMKDKKFKAAIIKSFILAFEVVLLTLLLMHLMNAEVAGFLGYAKEGEPFYTDLKIGLFDLYIVKAHAGYFSILLLFMIITSIFLLLSKKKIIPVLFLIIGIIFYYGFGMINTVAPKHLSYYTLFWAFIILTGLNLLDAIKPILKKIIISVMIFLFIIQYIIGLRIDMISIPYQFDRSGTLNPVPTLLSLANIKLNMTSFKNAEFVIGTGTKISTSDELNASSGLLFSPVMWHKQKEGLFESFIELSLILNHFKNDTLFLNVTDGSSQFVINSLLTNGFIWQEKKIDFASDVQHLTFIKTGYSIIKLSRFNVNKDNFETFLKGFENVKKNNFYFIFIWDWQNYYMKKMDLPFIASVTNQIHKLNNK